MTSSPEHPERVRLAPSPTGYFHVGTARTALYNLCVARRTGGVFILRIEDTDKQRHQEEQYHGILEALRWLGIAWDEGPYRQSERSRLYGATADLLWQSANLYACDCTREAVEMRTKGKKPGYDGYCRERGLDRGPGTVLRFKVPAGGTTVVHDLVRGDVEFANSTIEDFVVQRSNGDALFVLAVVTDDRDMAVSLVTRAEEHLPSTPKAILIWEALNAADPAAAMPLPQFAHLPLLVNSARQKISKRRPADRVAIEDYRRDGYLPDAMANYLALLGWSFPDGREFFTRGELVEAFRFEDVNHSPAFFDIQKLQHFNGTYIRALALGEFTERCRGWSAEAADPLGTCYFGSPEWTQLAPLVQERVSLLSEVPSYVEFLFGDFAIDDASWAKAVVKDAEAGSILAEARASYAGLAGQWEAGRLKEALEGIAEAHDRKLGKAQAPVRVATLGRTIGLPLFESLQVLGPESTLERLDKAIGRLGP
ncbi:MAG: glutamate--tRNA ligase [Acidimicrobiales bacterium]